MNRTRVSAIAIEHSASQTRRSLIWIALAATLLSMLLTACGDDDAVEAKHQELSLNATPAASADASAGVNTVTLTIKSGKFEQDELVLLQNRPTKLYIQNKDDSDYEFEIVNMVKQAKIDGNHETVLEFTTPNEGFYNARLVTGNDLFLKAKLAVVVAVDGD